MKTYLVTRSRTVTIEQRVRLDAPDQATAEDLDWASVPEVIVDVIDTSITAEPI